MKTENLPEALIIENLLANAVRWQPVGSRVTCNPAPTGTDQDYLVLVDGEEVAEDFVNSMKAYGFDVELGEGYAEDALNSDNSMGFQSYRSGGINLIVTVDYEFYELFKLATSVAKHLNLLDKGHRIALFQAMLYGNSPEAPF